MEDSSALDFGARLAEARMRSGLTLDEIAEHTKIRTSMLAAIERCEVSHLPGGLYIREFLRAFAREVGCDPEEIVAQYRERFRAHILAVETIAITDPELQLTCASGQVSVAEIDAVTRRWRAGWIVCSVVLLLTVATYELLSSKGATARQNQARESTMGSAAISPVTLPPSVAAASMAATAITASPDRMVATSGTVPRSGEVQDLPANELRLDLKPTAPCWMSATADGRSVLYRLMNAGERAEISAREELVLRIGDPSGCDFEVNGVAARRLGDPGRPVTIHMTPKNFVDFLRP